MDNTHKSFNISDITLSVPQTTAYRQQIKNAVENYFAENNFLPPVSYEKLTEFANLLVEKFGWEKEFKAFVMVCCGNAIWRNIVETIPFDRRILLLPECLKNSSSCKAEQDELGLLCSECGACSISGILRYAENLGYTALVTEGTTVTTRLIESGKIDAVIGVGCMEVLQKMFASVTKYAIPGIGVPLIEGGCQDSIADTEWLKKEISHYQNKNNIRLVNLNHLKKRISAIFSNDSIAFVSGEAETETEKIAREALLNEGHRWRPFLAVLAYESFSQNPDNAVSQKLAVSVECFHKASLIHDDIEDNDTHRNGHESLHVIYQIPIALNIGDFLIGEGYRVIARMDLPAEILSECFTIAAKGHTALAIGQGEELLATTNKKILSLEKILSVFENKTAAAFKVSLLMGAQIGGADKKSLELLTEFSRLIGIAYQIQDDLSDFQGDNGDILVRKFSIILSILFENLVNGNSKTAYNLVYNQQKTEIFNLIEQHAIIERTESLLKEYIQKAVDCLDQFDNIVIKLALHEILRKIFDEYI